MSSSEISYFRLLWVCSLLAAFARNACHSSCLKCIIETQISVIPVATRQIVYVCVQSLSCVCLFATPWPAALQASLSFTVSWSLLRFMSIDSVLLCNYLIVCLLLLLLPSIFPNISVFSKESALCIRCLKYWSFSIRSSNENLGLISFRIDWFDLLEAEGTLKSLLQLHN